MNAFTPIEGLTVRAADLDRPEERQRIDAFVRAHPEAQPFHLTGWSRAVEQGCGQRSRYLVAEDGAGRIAGLLPLTEMRSRLFGSSLVSAGFAVGGGILADDGQPVASLADEAWRLAEAAGHASVELRGGALPEGWSRAQGTYANFAKDLPATDDAILASIPRKQRAEVRRALGNGLDVSIGREERHRAAHYRVYSESVRNLGTPVFPRSLFDSMLEELGEEADVLVIGRNGTPLASVLSVYFRGAVYPYWGGGTAEARGARANELLYFELMRHAARRGCTRFEFGRSKVGTGAFAFKKNWGFEPKPLVYFHRGAARETNPLSPRYRLQVGLWKTLPLAFANRLGPMISRGLG